MPGAKTNYSGFKKSGQTISYEHMAHAITIKFSIPSQNRFRPDSIELRPEFGEYTIFFNFGRGSFRDSVELADKDYKIIYKKLLEIPLFKSELPEIISEIENALTADKL